MVGLSVLSGSAQAQTPAYTFDIPAEPLGAALHDFARVSGQQIIFTDSLVAGKTVAPLHGKYTPDEALQRLLAGTGLVIDRSSPNGIMIQPKKEQAASNEAAPVGDIETVVVTGTNIRGVQPASPMVVLTSEDIARSGFTTTGAAINSLPQAFGGGQNSAVVGAPGGNNSANTGMIDSPNLRGLGSAATLTLVNGQRLAPSGGASAVDISIVPAALIDHIDVLTDGASAIYGDDAVAGVVNVILKNNYDGAETTLELGVPTQGGAFEQRYNQLYGTNWSDGNLVLDASYGKQDPLYANQRAFTSGALPATTLLPGSESSSFFGSVRQDITPDVSVFARGLYTQRNSAGSFSYSNIVAYPINNNVEQGAITAGVEWRMFSDWQSTLSFSGATEQLRYVAAGATSKFNNSTWSVDGVANGTLLELPTGPVKAGIGGGFQREGYSDSIGDGRFHRTVGYAFGELSVPAVTPNPEQQGLESLSVDLAGRWEDYSDFGTTAHPKIGVVYVPFSDLDLKGSWGTSFRAPSLLQQHGATDGEIVTWPFPADLPAGKDVILVGLDGNPDLKPETSTDWTVGGEFHPSSVEGLNLSAYYYDVRYRGQIQSPITSLLSSFSNPTYAPFVTKNPTPAMQQALVQLIQSSGGVFQNFTSGPFDPSTVGALIDDRTQNIAISEADGVDLGISYATTIRDASVNFFGSATWLNLKQQALVGAPVATISGTVFNPPEWRARVGATADWGRFNGQVAVNYIGSELDNVSVPNVSVGAFVTADLSLGYSVPVGDGPFGHGLKANLTVQNIFDTDPPRTGPNATFVSAIRYDSTNASPLGRVVRLQLSVDW
jgi:outer membrane receptor protein involved in Fe transport